MSVMNNSKEALINKDENRPGELIGSRIKKIRIARGMTRSELGALVGLDQNRVQQYENGTRKPRRALLSTFATALSVDIRALSDPVVDDRISTMHALFAIEDLYGIEFYELDYGCGIRIKDDDIAEYLRQWKEEHDTFDVLEKTSYTENERAKFRYEYDNWRWRFSGEYSKENEKRSLEEEKEILENKLLQIQKRLTDLEQ